MERVILVIKSGGTPYDVSELVTKVVWSGRKGSAPRTVEATLVDNEQIHDMVKLNCGEGQSVFLYERGADGKDKELFRGILMSEKYSSNHQIVIKAYDVCVKLTNNKMSHTFKKKRADQVVRWCCKKLNIPVGSLEKTGHKMGSLVKKATTCWDMCEDALSQTYKVKKRRYFVYAEKGKIYLQHRKFKDTMPTLDLGSNIISWERTRSIENTRTRLKLVTSKGKGKGNYQNKELEKKIGVWREVETVDEKITKTEKKKRLNTFKMEKAVIGQSLTISTVGDSSVKTGGCVYVIIDSQNIKRAMYVEEDTHTWEKGKHEMKLKLDFAKT